MSQGFSISPSDRLQQLRESFDASFSRPAGQSAAEHLNVLLIRVGEAAYALPMQGIARFAAARPVTPLPGATMPLLGLAGLSGEIVPVYSLASLLAQHSSAPRWLIVSRMPEAMAFACDGFEGHRRLPQAEFMAQAQPAEARFCSGAVQVDGRLRPVLDMPAIVTYMRQVFPIGRGDKT